MSETGGQMPDMNALLQQAQQMSQQLMAQQAEAAATEVEGVAGGGAVIVRMTGGGEFRSVKIDPSAVDADDVEMLEDLVLAALNDAVANAANIVQGPDLGGMDLGGMDLGGIDLGGLLGGGD
ncbi:MAG: YbaB/EbfC family nucleoid-associated protein [Actinomycetota bacterium]